MPTHSFDPDDLFAESFTDIQNKPHVSRNQTVIRWKQLYREVYGVDYDRMNEANLFSACCELNRFCKANGADYEKYVRWGMSNFDIFSPRRLTTPKFLAAFNNSYIPETTSGGFFIIETKEIVPMVYQEDGQIALDIPPDGKAYINGNEVHVMKV